MEDGYVEIGCSIFMKGVMLLGHGNVFKVLEMDPDVDVLICLLPLGSVEGDAQLDYIVVRLPWDKCSEVICGEKAIGVGMVFDDGEFLDSEEELMGCWAQMTSARLARNAEIGAKKSKAIKKKASAPSFASGGEVESSAPSKRQRNWTMSFWTLTRPLGTETSYPQKPGRKISTRFIVPSRSGWWIAFHTRRTGFLAHSILSVSTLPPTQ
jgi:hypothetical protein